MNIFEILSQGKGSVNEENVSAFLAYLLNPNETHGLKNEFFKEFIKLVDKNLADTDDTLQLSNIRLEVPFYDKKGNKNNKRVMDIFLEVHSVIKGDIIIAIENKIDSSAVQECQLSEECSYICNEYKKSTPDNFKFVFLAPTECVQDKLDNPKADLPDTKRCLFAPVTWSQVTDSLKALLSKEHHCEISPLSDYVKHTLKSFIVYIDRLNEKVLKNAFNFDMVYKGKIHNFCLKQYSTNQVELFDICCQQNVPVYGAIYGLVEYCYGADNVNKSINTQQLARMLINYLQSDKSQKKLKSWNNQQLAEHQN